MSQYLGIVKHISIRVGFLYLIGFLWCFLHLHVYFYITLEVTVYKWNVFVCLSKLHIYLVILGAG